MKLREAKVWENTAPQAESPFRVECMIAVDATNHADALLMVQSALENYGETTATAAPSQPDPAPEKKTRRRRAKAEADEASEAAPAEEKKPRRRRVKKEEPEEPPEQEEEEEVKPRRRRRVKKEEPEGPTEADVAKAASALAEATDSDLAAEVIGEFSTDGTLAGIPADKRKDFIEDCELQMSVEDEED